MYGMIGQMNRYCTLIALWNATKYAMCASNRKYTGSRERSA